MFQWTSQAQDEPRAEPDDAALPHLGGGGHHGRRLRRGPALPRLLPVHQLRRHHQGGELTLKMGTI